MTVPPVPPVPSKPNLPTPPMAWAAWGDPARVTSLSEGQLALVHDALGVSAADVDAVPRESVVLRPSALTGDDVAALAGVVGDKWVSTSDGDRLPRAGGKSTLDLLRRKQRSEQDAPDGVVVPGS